MTKIPEEVAEELTLNLEIILPAVYDKTGNDVSNQYIESKTDDLDEVNEESNDYYWDITNLDLEILESPFYIFSEDQIEFKIQLDLTKNDEMYDKIYIILKSMPSNIKQLTIKYVIQIDEINVDISGIVTFTQNKLKLSLIDEWALNTSDNIKEMIVTVNTEFVSKYTA